MDMRCDMTTEQSERLSRIEDNIDHLKEEMGIFCNALTKANGDIEKLDVTLNGKVDKLDMQMSGKFNVVEQRFAGLEDKIDQIVRNTSRKEDNKARLYIAVIAAVIGGIFGALSRFI
jgi:uncharacterized ion transporter superfamily protein YfcC